MTSIVVLIVGLVTLDLHCESVDCRLSMILFASFAHERDVSIAILLNLKQYVLTFVHTSIY